ncbi:MAG: GtrA family protein [Rickettsiales bacterium]|nr:GtrA family protein [Rickettsiales bacterium]
MVGGWNTLFSLSLFIVVYTLLKDLWHYMVVAVICHIFSVMQSFITLKYFVFRTKGNLLHEYIRINITYLGSLFGNLLLLYIFCTIFRIDPRYASFMNAAIIAFFSYLLHKYFTFKTI